MLALKYADGEEFDYKIGQKIVRLLLVLRQVIKQESYQLKL